MAVLASELVWVVLLVGAAEAVRRGTPVVAVLATVYLVDIPFSLRLEASRPWWLWLVNAAALVVILQGASGLAAVQAMHDLPDDPPPAPPTPAMRAVAVDLEPAGFRPVMDHAGLIGDPEMHIWVLLRDDGTLAEVVHREPHDPGFAFRTQLDPAGPGYDTIVSVPWSTGWPAPTERRVIVAGGSPPALLAAHDAAIAEAVGAGARPVPVRPEDALANVLESDRQTARRVLRRPWRSMAEAYGLRRRRA